MKKIAINGFGRIGRLAFRLIANEPDMEVVAINDLTSAEELSYYLKYDTNHRKFDGENISFDNDSIIYKGKEIKVYSEKDPSLLPWRENDIDVVLECTGLFTKLDDAYKHIVAGAKHVIISAPGKGNMKTIVYGVNDIELDGTESVISAASCTTNCLAPVLNILNKEYGIEKGFMTTVHAMTNDQSTLDVPHKKGIKSRRGRAASLNIIPSSTGAASAIGKVIPELEGKLDGGALRVPVGDGSVVDLSLELKKNTSLEEINKLFKDNESEAIKITMDPVVSSDILGESTGALVDGLLTNVLTVNDKQLVKVVAWYDNEWGYTSQMIRTMKVLLEKTK
ncbi:MAG: type I glyceraldehyde-3-phosphate dehydrogenase [Bacilli bacterium]|nr:type I glyceraldehyde-3-phosphate dehydrogenase [Bacilli bacterium]